MEFYVIFHFHKNAWSIKGGEFTKYVGNGDGKGFDSGLPIIQVN